MSDTESDRSTENIPPDDADMTDQLAGVQPLASPASPTGDARSDAAADASSAAPSVLELLDLDDVPDEPDPDVIVDVGDVRVTGSDAQEVEVDLDHLCHVATAVLVGESVASARLDLHLVDRETMAELNGEHLGGSGPTDVLAFPLEDDVEVTRAERASELRAATDAKAHLGDVVICPSVAIEQAAGHSGSIAAEFTLLTIHGVLHVLGHDHAVVQDRVIMQAREREHLAGFGFDHPVPATSPADVGESAGSAVGSEAPTSSAEAAERQDSRSEPPREGLE